MPGLLEKPLFRGLFKNPVPISLLPSLPPSLPPHYTTPSEILAPREHSFQPEPRTSRCPLAKEAQCWALGKCLQTSLLSLLVFLPNRTYFLLPLKLGCIQKFLTSFKKRKMKNYTEEFTKAAEHQGREAASDTGKNPESPRFQASQAHP